jgi:hypothetical protein
MKKYSLVFVSAFLFLPSIVFAGGWLKDVGDKLGRGVISDATGIDVTKHEDGQAEASAEQGTVSSGYQRGTLTLACGCNGNVQIGATRSNQQCASGVDETVLCKGRCQGGGRPWAAVCQ